LRLLLDTHVLIWWAIGEPLATPAADAIQAPENELHVSAATVWEAEIKAAAGKLTLELELGPAARERGFVELPVTFEHAVAAARLPARHRDPFDRMLVAQAQVERLVLVTRDPVFDAYDVEVLRA
jgi:PIN domain nuclease of toxin-antitoxin system